MHAWRNRPRATCVQHYARLRSANMTIGAAVGHASLWAIAWPLVYSSHAPQGIVATVGIVIHLRVSQMLRKLMQLMWPLRCFQEATSRTVGRVLTSLTPSVFKINVVLVKNVMENATTFRIVTHASEAFVLTMMMLKLTKRLRILWITDPQIPKNIQILFLRA